MKAIVTVIGTDKMGIIAGVSTVLADHQVNIMDISQTILGEFFTMIMLVDLAGLKISFKELSDLLNEKGQQLKVQITIQREEIFKAMHKI